VQINDQHAKNKFVSHGGTCQHCGQEILPRRLRGKIVGRGRRFCSDKCRQAAFRNADFARRYQTPEALRNGKNNSTSSTVSNGDFAGRASADKARRKAVQAERPWLDSGQPIVSSDGVVCFVVGKLRRAR
jgi:hypothetical protein